MKGKHIKEALQGLFSVSFLKALGSSLGYYIHETVTWRKKMNRKGNLRVHATSSIRNPQNVFVGENSHINHQCCIWCGENSKITLGDNLLMGPGVKIFSTNHGMDIDKPMTFQKYSEADVTIGNDCWIGANCVILKGVNIPDGCVVAAGSVVSKSLTEPYAIYGGIPAKQISKRKKK
ncbi:acyltransferase [Chengkuizengella sp. SCS-71B]|uniref:acyltransferase n=1 Tax=Chengkuizengella sp. SCS-71B TaxID=3115290 RepID=UPI0032C236FC